jgi:hypothetical protein
MLIAVAVFLFVWALFFWWCALDALHRGWWRFTRPWMREVLFMVDVAGACWLLYQALSVVRIVSF